jgi:uncharacterized protein with GYD domain
MLEETGGTFQQFFMTMGAGGLALDDAIPARFQWLLGTQGNVRTSSMKAFSESAYREVIASLG